MIVVDNSYLALPGKQQEAIALFKGLAAFEDQRWPLTVPREVAVDITGETGRIHMINRKASLAEHEQHTVEMHADVTFQAFGQQLAALMVPGSFRTVYRRIV